MKAYIGPFTKITTFNWLENLLSKIGVPNHVSYSLTLKMCSSRTVRWFDSLKKRKIKVKIHHYDIWNVDQTIAIIAVPLIKRLKEKDYGYPHVDDFDVPFHLQSINDPDKENPRLRERWFYVLDRMIRGLEHCSTCDDTGESDDEYLNYHREIGRDLILFGKYFRCLWS